jgi:hypothetical protein
MQLRCNLQALCLSFRAFLSFVISSLPSFVISTEGRNLSSRGHKISPRCARRNDKLLKAALAALSLRSRRSYGASLEMTNRQRLPRNDACLDAVALQTFAYPGIRKLFLPNSLALLCVLCG